MMPYLYVCALGGGDGAAAESVPSHIAGAAAAGGSAAMSFWTEWRRYAAAARRLCGGLVRAAGHAEAASRDRSLSDVTTGDWRGALRLTRRLQDAPDRRYDGDGGRHDRTGWHRE